MTSPIVSAHLGRATLSNSGWYHDQLITFLAIGADTAGQFALLRVHGTQGAASARHYHADEDETLYLLEGELTVTAGGEELHAGPGDAVTIPRGLERAACADRHRGRGGAACTADLRISAQWPSRR